MYQESELESVYWLKTSVCPSSRCRVLPISQFKGWNAPSAANRNGVSISPLKIAPIWLEVRLGPRLLLYSRDCCLIKLSSVLQHTVSCGVIRISKVLGNHTGLRWLKWLDPAVVWWLDSCQTSDECSGSNNENDQSSSMNLYWPELIHI